MGNHVLYEFLTEKHFRRVNNGQRDYSIPVENKREITYKVLAALIQDQVAGEIKDEFYFNRKIKIPTPPQNYTNQQDWDNFCKEIKRDTKLYDMEKKIMKGILPFSELVGYNKFKGTIDQYIWDNNEDVGKILFSDQKGETLNFQNKEIHYYKKSVIDPSERLQDILRRIQ